MNLIESEAKIIKNESSDKRLRQENYIHTNIFVGVGSHVIIK